MGDYEMADLPVRNKAARPLTDYEAGEIDGKAARAAGSYTAEERARFIRANHRAGDSYTRGFIAGLRSG